MVRNRQLIRTQGTSVELHHLSMVRDQPGMSVELGSIQNGEGLSSNISTIMITKEW
jgi:hypothetical protein